MSGRSCGARRRAPARGRRPPPEPLRARSSCDGLADRRRVRVQPREQRAEHARAGLRVGQRAVRHADLDPERVGERGEPAAPLQRREPARHRDRAEHRRLRPVERRARERPAQHADVEARRVRDQHAPAQQPAEVGQHRLGRRRAVDHLLRDPGEALDPARQRLGDADERGPAVVQLAAADEHRADLGQLAALAGEPVRLRVDGDELGRRERRGQQVLGGQEHRHANGCSYSCLRTARTPRCTELRHGAPGRV